MCEKRSPDYLDEALSSTNLRVAKIKETPCPLPEARPIVLVHATAENVCPSERACELEIVKLAAAEAYRLLALNKGGALEAVEAAIRSVETLHFGFERINDDDDHKEIETDAGILEVIF